MNKVLLKFETTVMKRILKISAVLCATAAVSLSCLKEGGALSAGLTLDKTEVTAEGTSAAELTVKVTADGDWFAIAPEWIEVTPAVGSGSTDVKIKVADNVDGYKELAGPRSGYVSFCYGTDGISALLVNQKGENGLDSSRQYSKVTEAEDITAGSYLIAFVNGGKTLALKPFSATSETYYSYLYADEVTDKDGVVETQNANNSFVFVETEGGYRLKMSNGRYLFQASSHDNFYSTDTETKGDVWSVALNEDGTVKIANVTVSNKYIQYSTSHSSAGAYDSDQDGVLLPVLYKDSKPVSTEVLVVPETVSVTAESTTATISVTSNTDWKVRCHDGWIKDFTKSGSNDGVIEISFDANESTTDARTATFLVIGEESNVTVTFIQNKIATTVAELVEQIVSTNSGSQSQYSVTIEESNAAVVSYVNGNNVFIEDETGGVLLFKNNHGFIAGTKIYGKLTGSGYIFKSLPEITSLDGATTAAGGEIPCTEITLSELLKNYDRYISCRVLLKNVTVTDAIDGSDRDGKVKSGDDEIAVRAQSQTLSLSNGKTGDLIAFPSIYNGNKQLAFFENDQFTEKTE